jgi:hypothetical protein
MSHVSADALLPTLNDIVRRDVTAPTVTETLGQLVQRLETSSRLMVWEVVPLSVFAGGLPESIRSCWIFVIRAGAATGAERHPNSHQRSFSLIGGGTFELRVGTDWHSYALGSTETEDIEQRWVSIPPSTWHRLKVGPDAWGMLSFHTVAPEALIEERPVDANDLNGETHQERYADRR